MEEREDRWAKLEEIVRRVVREEIAGLKKKAQITFERGRWNGITDEQRSAWREAYGSCDVEAELKKAGAWIVSNPHLAPRSQFGRFLNTWLARQQTTLSIHSIPTRSEAPRQRTCSYCEKPTTGSVGGIWYCNDHSLDAMDRKPVLKSA